MIHFSFIVKMSKIMKNKLYYFVEVIEIEIMQIRHFPIQRADLNRYFNWLLNIHDRSVSYL